MGLYVLNKTNYQAIEQCSYIDDGVQSIFIAFEFQGDHFIIKNIYRPPRGNMNSFIEKLSIMLESSILKYRNYKLHILGDFNMNILKYIDCENVQNFINMICFSSDYVL